MASASPSTPPPEQQKRKYRNKTQNVVIDDHEILPSLLGG